MSCCVCVSSRRKSAVSRERLKLLFKQHCEPQNGTIALKVTTWHQSQAPVHTLTSTTICSHALIFRKHQSSLLINPVCSDWSAVLSVCPVSSAAVVSFQLAAFLQWISPQEADVGEGIWSVLASASLPSRILMSHSLYVVSKLAAEC